MLSCRVSPRSWAASQVLTPFRWAWWTSRASRVWRQVQYSFSHWKHFPSWHQLYFWSKNWSQIRPSSHCRAGVPRSSDVHATFAWLIHPPCEEGQWFPCTGAGSLPFRLWRLASWQWLCLSLARECSSTRALGWLTKCECKSHRSTAVTLCSAWTGHSCLQ